ncbi:class I SAM-dependent DNA methyltransferase [Sphingosinicella humi]|uniref:class I SAM-dependent DNA methyltransferase n=1 Tax=Allosphingosinicella humi TaxID=2068657 RepID=UPI001A9C4280|nr:class I SAM-dependent DNA methyltransferase [Sphingosinicella humi]
MRLGWNEIRIRAREFSRRWKDAHYEKGETQTFYNEFFQIFGIDRKKVAIFERKIQMIDANKRGFIDLFWPSVLLVEQKSAGRDLFKAEGQALDYVLGLRDREVPRFVLTCDFQRFRLLELETRREVAFTLPELHKNVEAFAFMLGVERRHYGKQTAVNIKAAELLGTLHDALEAKGYKGVELERLMVRLLFCLFADDTGIFESKDDFLYLIEERTDEDGGNVGRVLMHLFEMLDTPVSERLEGDDPEFAKFPYVNGDLFKGRLRTPVFDAQMRDDLLTAAKFDWGKVSPAIFGSLFQSVMDKDERRKKGAHYTTEPNIMKLIGPLFLDDLREELDRLKARRDGGRRAALLAFQEKLGSLNFFDPACGCGNFLVVTYRELRRMEQEALEQIYDPNSPMMLEVEALSIISVDQFHGIELEEFPAHIAEVAMWMTEHLANIELGRTFGKVFADIPLKDSANIVHGDALAIDWDDVLPHQQCFAVMGNPPFVGAKYQSPEQRAQVRELAALGKSGGTLDYVAAWFLKAGAYIAKGPTRIGFVATNSITQGEQVAQLWPILFDRYGLEIDFAHRTFAWGSDARGKAHVHVVIVGLSHRDHERREKRLFSYDDINGEPDESRHPALTAYLFGAENVANRHLVVKEEARPLSGSPRLRTGVQMIDNGILTFTHAEKRAFLETEPEAAPLFREFLGGEEYINGFTRSILYLADADPALLRRLPQVTERMRQLREYRAASRRASTVAMATFPTKLGVDERLGADYLVIPNTSSERREYVPIGWLGPDVIANQKLRILPNADLWEFGVLTSRMHMAWMRAITGRMKSDYMYSVGIVYNTYPWPETADAQKVEVEKLAQAVLAARAEWPTSSLADLYDPDTMPANLRKAHAALDAAVDRLYRRKPFDSDRDRVEHLFGLYEALVDPLRHEGVKQVKRVERLKRRKEQAAEKRA